MTQAEPRVRIILVQPSDEACAEQSRESLGALDRLGGEFEVSVVHDAKSCLDLCDASDVDLVVVEDVLGDEARELVGALREKGPPVIAVLADAADTLSLDWFRRGAADCVSAGPGARVALPVAALEEIRRWRALRDRATAERRMQRLEHLHRAIVNRLPAALLVLDDDARVVTVNPEFTAALGIPAERAEGRAFDDVLPADLVESADLRALVRGTQGGARPAARIGRSESAEGRFRAFDVRGERLDGGRVLLVLSDVTERESLVKRIGELQRYNENIIQNMNSALVVVDTDGRVTFANAPAGEILGEEAALLRGRSVWRWFAPREGGRPLLERSLEEGERFRGVESFITRSDGTRVSIGISCSPIVDAGGARLGAVAIFQDLTGIQQLQRQVLQTEKMASIGQLAAGVAHEINNPMGFIHANLFQMAEYLEDVSRLWKGAEDLQRAVSGGEVAEIGRAAECLAAATREIDPTLLLSDFAKAVQESQEGSERIRHIVQDLRDFSHPDTEERVLADVNQCLESTISIVWTMMKHLVTLEKEYGELPALYCYPMQLKQVFLNLLVNAYQAIEERVRQSGGTGRIWLRTRCEGDRAVVSVSDTGGGIAPEHLDRIFDPFFTTKEVGAGIGLGLSTSYNLVQRHGGTIRVHSELGHGTTFDVELPLAGPEESDG